MRVTDNVLRMAFLSALAQAQQRIADTQNQVATGRRVNLPSDDPFAAARIGELDASLSRLEQYRSNGGLAVTRLGLEEATLVSVIDNLQRVRELAVQGNNATLGDADRAAVATEMRQRLQSVLTLANATDQNGHYIFSGYSESTLPFAPGPGGVSYNGDEGQRHLQLSDERLVATNDSGSEVFQRIPNGNGTIVVRAVPSNTGAGVLGAASATDPAAFVPDTYAINFLSPADYEIRDSGGGLVASGTYADGQAIAFLGVEIVLTGVPAAGDSFSVVPSSSQDVFATLQALIDTLERPVTDQASRSLLHNDMGQALVDIDQAVNHMIDVRAEIGARIRAIEQEADLIDDFSLQLTESLSELRDLDYAEALSLLTTQLFGLEAAQQTFARTQGLSLFRYL